MKIEIHDLHFSYGKTPILYGLTSLIPAGKLTFLLGENGSGKTTLLKCLLGLLPYQGHAFIDGREIRSMKERQRAQMMAYIPQSHAPSFNYLVKDVVLMGQSSRNSLLTLPGPQQELKSLQALQNLGIEHLAMRGYAQLSGGERQLVLIARALAQETQILIMDEPSSNLDFGHQMKLLEQARSLRNQGYTVIMSSHHPQQAMQFGDHAILLHQGKIFADGAIQEAVTEEALEKLYRIPIDIKDVEGQAIPLYRRKS